MRVDEGRQHRQALGLHHLGAAGVEVGADRDDDAARDVQVGDGVDAGRGVVQAGAADEDVGGRAGALDEPHHQATAELVTGLATDVACGRVTRS